MHGIYTVEGSAERDETLAASARIHWRWVSSSKTVAGQQEETEMIRNASLWDFIIFYMHMLLKDFRRSSTRWFKDTYLQEIQEGELPGQQACFLWQDAALL